jgi:hypothetical protein
VLHDLSLQRGADAAVLELGQQHQLAQVDEVRTVLHAYVADRHAVAFNNLMSRRVPTIPKKRVLRSYIPRAELAFNDVAIGSVVHVAPEVGIGCRRQSTLQLHGGMMPDYRQAEHQNRWL